MMINSTCKRLNDIRLYSKKYGVIYKVSNSNDSIRYCVEQNTNKWINLRSGIGASSVADFIGIGYNTPEEAWDRIYNNIKMDETDPIKHGNEFEDTCVSVFEDIANVRTFMGYLWKKKSTVKRIKKRNNNSGNHNPFDSKDWKTKLCSPDRSILYDSGIKILDDYFIKKYKDNMYNVSNFDKAPIHGLLNNKYLKSVLEIKAPYGELYENVKEEHIAQTQYQAWITGVPYVEYCAVKIVNRGDEKGKVLGALYARVYRSEIYIKWMLKFIEKAIECLRTGIKPDWGRHPFYNIPQCKVDILFKGKINKTYTESKLMPW